MLGASSGRCEIGAFGAWDSIAEMGVWTPLSSVSKSWDVLALNQYLGLGSRPNPEHILLEVISKSLDC